MAETVLLYDGGLPVDEQTLTCSECGLETSCCEFVGEVCCVCFNKLTFRSRATADDANWRERWGNRRLEGFTAFPAPRPEPAPRHVPPPPPPRVPPPPQPRKPRGPASDVNGMGTGQYRAAAQAKLRERDDARLEEILEELDHLLSKPTMTTEERNDARKLGQEMERIVTRRREDAEE